MVVALSLVLNLAQHSGVLSDAQHNFWGELMDTQCGPWVSNYAHSLGLDCEEWTDHLVPCSGSLGELSHETLGLC